MKTISYCITWNFQGRMHVSMKSWHRASSRWSQIWNILPWSWPDFVLGGVCPYLKSDEIRFYGSAGLGGVRGWKVKGKTVRREADATFPLAFQQLVQTSWGTLPSDALFPPSPVHFPSISSLTFTVPKFELPKHLFLEETLTLPLSILLSPCRWDSFPDFFPKTVEETLLLVTEKMPSWMLRELFCWLVRSPASSWIFLGWERLFSGFLWH